MSGPIDERELRHAILGLAGSTTAKADQAQSMTDAELADRLLSGRWSTVEVFEAARRLKARVSVEQSE